MTTLEMLNASKEEPGVKFYATQHPGYYCAGCQFYMANDKYDHSRFNYVMGLTWEREKPEPLRGEIECEVMFNSCGDYACDLARRVRETFGDTVKDKRFRFKGTVEEIV